MVSHLCKNRTYLWFTSTAHASWPRRTHLPNSMWEAFDIDCPFFVLASFPPEIWITNKLRSDIDDRQNQIQLTESTEYMRGDLCWEIINQIIFFVASMVILYVKLLLFRIDIVLFGLNQTVHQSSSALNRGHHQKSIRIGNYKASPKHMQIPPQDSCWLGCKICAQVWIYILVQQMVKLMKLMEEVGRVGKRDATLWCFII